MYIIIGIFISFLIFLLKYFRIKILTPTGLYCYMWIFFIVGGIIFLHGSFQFSYLGILWILISILLVIIFRFIFNKYFYKFLNKNDYLIKNKQSYLACISWKLLIIIISLAFLSVGYLMYKNGISLDVFTDFSSLQSTSHNMSVLRYTQENSSSLVEQIINSFLYIAPLCAGYSLPYATIKKERIICFISFIPSLLSLLISSAKLTTVCSVILFFIGYYVSYIQKNKKIPYFKKKDIFVLIIVSMCLFFIFYLSFLLRIGESNINNFNTIINKLVIYSFGHIQAFDLWFSNFGLFLNNLDFGSNTFLAISSRIGLAVKEPGIYNYINGSSSNIFTYFRGYIEDFGIVITMFLIVIIIYIMEYCLLKLKKSFNKNIFQQFFLSILLFSICYYIVSPWVYASYFFTFFIFYIYIYVSYGAKIVIKI